MIEINDVGIKTTEDLLEAIQAGQPGDIHVIYYAFEIRYGKQKALEELEAVIYKLMGKEWKSGEWKKCPLCRFHYATTQEFAAHQQKEHPGPSCKKIPLG